MMKTGFKTYLKDTDAQILMNESEVSEINEAVFNTKNMRKVSDLLAKIASKKLGTTFWLGWSEDFKKGSGVSGSGLRYISASGQQLRFNHVNNKNTFTINSVDYWKEATSSNYTKPEMSLYFKPGINIVQLKTQLFDTIKWGREVPIKAKDLLEAKFLTTEMLESSAKERHQRRKDFATEYDLPRSSANTDKVLQKKVIQMGLEQEYENWMDIKLGDSEKSSTQDNINKSEKEFKSGKVYSDPILVFEDLEALLPLIAQKKWKSLMVCGDAGIGKTWHITEGPNSLKKLIGPEGQKWMYYGSLKPAPFAFYQLLFRDRNDVIVFDESDNLLLNDEIILMLKSLLDTSGKNYAQYSNGTYNTKGMSEDELDEFAKGVDAMLADGASITTGREKPGQVKLPSKFEFTGSMVFISNLPYSKIDKAVMSRSIFFDIELAEHDKVKRIEMIGKLKVKDNPDITEAHYQMVMRALGGSTSKEPEHKVQYMTPEFARTRKEISIRAMELGFLIASSKDIPESQKERLISLYS